MKKSIPTQGSCVKSSTQEGPSAQFERITDPVCDRLTTWIIPTRCYSGRLKVDGTAGDSCFDRAFDFEITDGPILDAFTEAWKSGLSYRKHIPWEGRKRIIALLNLHAMAFDFGTQARLRDMIVKEVFGRSAIYPEVHLCEVQS